MSEKEHGQVRYRARVVEQSNVPTAGKVSSSQLLPQGTTGYARQPSVFNTGHPLADKGLGCNEKNTPSEGCLLTPQQRSALMDIYAGRLAGAQTAYFSALGQLSFEELIRKEPERSELVMDLLLEVVGFFGGKVALRMFKLLKTGGSISDITLPPGELTTALHRESQEDVKEAIVSAVSLGKAASKQALKKEATLSPTQTANLNYLDLLKDRATIVFQHLREHAPVGLSDSLLLVLVESYDGTNGHTHSGYKRELADKLSRFQSSGVGKLGQLEAPKYDPMTVTMWSGEEMRAYWVNTPVGRRLGLYKRMYRKPHKVAGDEGWRDMTPVETVQMQRRDLERSPYVLAGYVPEEFEDAAVHIHTAKWGSPPLQHELGVHEIAQMGAAK